jgi:hypothetical protein
LKADIAVYEVCRLFDPIGLRAMLTKPSWKDVLEVIGKVWDDDPASGKRAPTLTTSDLDAAERVFSR